MTTKKLQQSIAKRSIEPTIGLVSLSEAREHVNLSSSDTTHDTKLTWLIALAREQLEEDTGVYVAEQTWQLTLDSFYEFRFSQRPVMSIDTVTYYNASNVSTTLDSSRYVLDSFRNQMMQTPGDNIADWPVTYDRFDAVTVTYTVGETDEVASVRPTWKQAALLLIGFYFENPDMLMADALQSMRSYEMLVRKLQRSTYP